MPREDELEDQLSNRSSGSRTQTGVWSALKRPLGNLALHTTDALAALVKTGLHIMQYRRDGLLDGFIAETGLGLEPS